MYTGRYSRPRLFKTTEGSTYRTVTTVVEMDIEIDMEKLKNYFARKLATSKGNRSRILNGIVTAKAVSKKDHIVNEGT